MNNFKEKLQTAARKNHSLLCVGLDPLPARMPRHLPPGNAGIAQFCREIVDATAPFVCAFKPQIAYFAAHSAEAALQETIAHIHRAHADIPVILDAKRGDIDATMRAYASEVFDRYNADAATVNPYLGGDAMQCFFDYADKGVFVLCRTSNPGGGELQQLRLAGGGTLAQHIAQLAADEWNANGNLGLVVGATYAEDLARVRQIAGDMPILAPGVGAQGGDLRATLQHGLTANGDGLIINASRGVIFAGDGRDYAEHARRAASTLRDEINAHRANNA